MVVANWIRNDKGQYLIQKRNKPLREYVDPWSVTAGSAIAGEMNIEAVQRETLEEMGLYFKQEEFRFMERTFFDDFFMDVFETTWNGRASEIDFDPVEVQDVKWVTGNELRKMYRSKDFYDHKTVYLTRILDIEENIAMQSP
nr:NUDIX domain-containing protein [Spirochaeta isovalerica]